jgi:hypothetical protein
MAKVKRSILKHLVKECLVEILLEGLYEDDESSSALQEAVSPRRLTDKRPGSTLSKTQARKKILSEKIASRPSASTATRAPSDFMGTLTNEPIMAQIFADTANTTLPAMVAGEQPGGRGGHGYAPADGAAKMVGDHDLDDLFEGSTNWATLAFSSEKKAP